MVAMKGNITITKNEENNTLAKKEYTNALNESSDIEMTHFENAALPNIS